MREPKFRGFSLETKQWHYGHGWFEIDYTDDYLREKGIEPQALLYTGSYPVECELKSMGEFTGLKDKNGREIYEGDIVNFVDFDTTGGHRDDREYKGVVKFQSGIYEIWRNNDSEFFESDGPFILNYAWLQDDEFEVIGNIYEHPHLLEGDSIENQ